MTLTVVSTTERPDLVPTVAGWVWEEFWRSHGHTLEQTAEAVAATVAARDLPQTYVLLLDDWPVGTATLAARDLEERGAIQSDAITLRTFRDRGGRF